MGTSLGELFISLGFDVDDAKLKNFREGLRDTHDEINRLGKSAAEAVGILGAAFAGMSLFIQNSADNAVRLNNMALAWGANARAAQTYANALHQVNSQISVESGQQMYGKFAQFINASIPLGDPHAMALNALGGEYDPGKHQDATEILFNLARHYHELKDNPNGPYSGARYGKLLEQLPGLDENVIRMMADRPEAYSAAAQYDMTGNQQEKFTEYAKSTAEFSEAITKFDNVVASHLAPAMTQFFHAITAILNKASSSEDQLGDFLLRQKERMGIFGFLPGPMVAGGIYDHFFSASSSAAINGNGSISPLSSALDPAIMRRLFEESGLNPNKYGHGREAKGMPGEAYGIAQWHPDRQRMFKMIMGHDIHGSSLDEQEQFVNWELMHGDVGARRAEREMAKTQNEEEKYKIFTKYFERPKGAENIVINVNSNATDNHEVANLVKQHFQGIINPANAQTNQNPG